MNATFNLKDPSLAEAFDALSFNLKDPSLAEAFDALCQTAGISGLKGHRSVGGYRASMYNALPIDSVEVLVDCMQVLEQKY